MTQNLQILKFVLPTLLGSLSSMICPMDKTDGSRLVQRPPAYVFGIVWPLLYALIGYSWMHSNTNLENMLFVSLNSFLCLWIIVWSCMKDKKKALYIIVMALTNTIMLIKVSNYGLYMCPLFGWLLYAMLLNYHSVI